MGPDVVVLSPPAFDEDLGLQRGSVELALGVGVDRACIETERDVDAFDQAPPELISVPHGGDKDERGPKAVGLVVCGGAIEQRRRLAAGPRMRVRPVMCTRYRKTDALPPVVLGLRQASG